MVHSKIVFMKEAFYNLPSYPRFCFVYYIYDRLLLDVKVASSCNILSLSHTTYSKPQNDRIKLSHRVVNGGVRLYASLACIIANDVFTGKNDE